MTNFTLPADPSAALTLDDFFEIAERLPPDAGCMTQVKSLKGEPSWHMLAALLYFARDSEAAKVARRWIAEGQEKGMHLDDAQREIEEGRDDDT